MMRTAWQAGFVALAALVATVQANELGLQLPDGFSVTLFADDDLAHNIHALTVDSLGRVVVAGPGYIKILHDDNGDGRADRATLFSSLPASGAHSMYFDGRNLLCTGDGAVRLLRDADADDQADDQVGEIWTRLGHSEHGANGVVKGPDGYFYMICGNNAGVGRDHVVLPGSPVIDPKCGALMRFAPDGQASDVVAHGFRNPYDLDFNSRGQVFTVDSDNERDHALPWYAPTRLFDIASGLEHGWLLDGWQRSWNRPESYFDNVERLVEFGRGSPTGVLVYRHRQFPRRYRDGLFSCCWTMGRVYFVPLVPRGSTYEGQVEIFLQSTGELGFAPVDLAVDPLGDLYVAIGGRGTRGGVFRIRYEPTGPVAPRTGRLLTRVLRADQPLSSWSRAAWTPLAQKLGPQPFEGVVIDASANVADQLRAVEVLVELFDGLSEEVALEALAVRRPELSARVAWALARKPDRRWSLRLLAELTEDAHPAVERAAWEGLLAVVREQRPKRSPVAAYSQALASDDRRVRAASLLVAAELARSGHSRLDRLYADAAPADQLLAAGWLDLGADPLGDPLEVFLTSAGDTRRRLDAVRWMLLKLGDLRIQPDRDEVYSGYQTARVARFDPQRRAAVAAELAAQFPADDAELNRELARLLGALEADSPGLLAALVGQFSAGSDPLHDIHYLIVLSLLPGARAPEVTNATADALVQLAGKMESRRLYPDRFWPMRITEVFQQLCQRDAALPLALASHRQFGRAEHCLFAEQLSGQPRNRAARAILDQLQSQDDETLWTSAVVRLVGSLDTEVALSVLRAKWEHYALRDDIVPILARAADPADRHRLFEALDSPQADVVTAAAKALARMPETPASADEIGVTLRGLRSFCLTAEQRPVRQALVDLLHRLTAQRLELDEQQADSPLAAYQPWFDWFAERHPAEAAGLFATIGVDLAEWQARLPSVDWNAGDVARGRQAFEKRACHRCHTGGGKLGPDLAGVATRFSRDDLFTAIIDPAKDVAPLYRTTMIVTRGGQVHHGLIVYQSSESTLLQSGPDKTVRILGADVETVLPSRQSIMPTGLLNGASNQELADLYAYLRTLVKGQ